MSLPISHCIQKAVITGRSGSGKSVLLETVIEEAIQSARCVAILDLGVNSDKYRSICDLASGEYYDSKRLPDAEIGDSGLLVFDADINSDRSTQVEVCEAYFAMASRISTSNDSSKPLFVIDDAWLMDVKQLPMGVLDGFIEAIQTNQIDCILSAQKLSDINRGVFNKMLLEEINTVVFMKQTQDSVRELNNANVLRDFTGVSEIVDSIALVPGEYAEFVIKSPDSVSMYKLYKQDGHTGYSLEEINLIQAPCESKVLQQNYVRG